MEKHYENQEKLKLRKVQKKSYNNLTKTFYDSILPNERKKNFQNFLKKLNLKK